MFTKFRASLKKNSSKDIFADDPELLKRCERIANLRLFTERLHRSLANYIGIQTLEAEDVMKLKSYISTGLPPDDGKCEHFLNRCGKIVALNLLHLDSLLPPGDNYGMSLYKVGQAFSNHAFAFTQILSESQCAYLSSLTEFSVSAKNLLVERKRLSALPANPDNSPSDKSKFKASTETTPTTAAATSTKLAMTIAPLTNDFRSSTCPCAPQYPDPSFYEIIIADKIGCPLNSISSTATRQNHVGSLRTEDNKFAGDAENMDSQEKATINSTEELHCGPNIEIDMLVKETDMHVGSLRAEHILDRNCEHVDTKNLNALDNLRKAVDVAEQNLEDSLTELTQFVRLQRHYTERSYEYFRLCLKHF